MNLSEPNQKGKISLANSSEVFWRLFLFYTLQKLLIARSNWSFCICHLFLPQAWRQKRYLEKFWNKKDFFNNKDFFSRHQHKVVTFFETMCFRFIQVSLETNKQTNKQTNKNVLGCLWLGLGRGIDMLYFIYVTRNPVNISTLPSGWYDVATRRGTTSNHRWNNIMYFKATLKQRCLFQRWCEQR